MENSKNNKTHVEGPGGQCDGHLGGVHQEILLDLNILGESGFSAESAVF